MKVMCTIPFETNKCQNSNRIVPAPEVCDIDTVVCVRKYMGTTTYILERFPKDVGYETFHFSPLSKIDETEMVRENNLVNQ